MLSVTVEDIIRSKDRRYSEVYAQVKLLPKYDIPGFDNKIDIKKIIEDNLNNDIETWFTIGYIDKKLTANITSYSNRVLTTHATKNITPEKAVELIVYLSEYYNIDDTLNTPLVYEGFRFYPLQNNVLRIVAYNVPNLISWALSKYNKDIIEDIIRRENNAKILKNLIDNEDVVQLLGVKEIQNFRKKLITLNPEIYENLQKELSILTDVEIRENKVFHDSVLLNILSEYVDSYGVYNVMKEIKNRYKKHTFLEKRNWSILKQIDPVPLAKEIQKRTSSVQGFLNLFDLFLRIASKSKDDNDNLLNECNDAFITGYKILHKTPVYLPGLEKLETEIVNIGLDKWIVEKLPTINRFM